MNIQMIFYDLTTKGNIKTADLKEHMSDSMLAERFSWQLI